MSENQDSHYFEVIEEQLQQNKLVTFKWLSRKLKIHCAIAKSLMEKFVLESANKSYVATYLIFGKTEEGDLIITLSKLDDLSSLKDDCVTVVDKYVYCIESQQNQFDALNIYDDDKSTYKLNQLCLSSINYPSEIVPKAVSSKFKNTTVEDENNKLKSDLAHKSTQQESPSEVRTDGKTTAKKVENVKLSNTTKGNLTQLFNNQRLKNTNTDNVSTNNDGKKSTNTTQFSNNVSTNNDGKKSTKLSQLFEKQRQKNANKKTTDVESSTNNGESMKDNTSETIGLTKIEKNAAKKTLKQDMSNKSSKSNKSKGKKKMRRIIAHGSSSEEQSSEEENTHMEEELEYQPEPEPEADCRVTETPDSVRLIAHGKKRKRKVVEKTVCDEDGYLHTTKEFVYESCESDEDDENNTNLNVDNNKRMKRDELKEDNLKIKTENNKVPVKGVANNLPSKTKQASIMNFFKKS